MRRVLASIFAGFLALWPAAATALPGVRQLLTPPVDAAVSRPFDGPATAFAAGHRGIDYAVASGTPVRAAAAGKVKFAGRVAGNIVVSLEHPGSIETTYSILSEVLVEAGENVGQGRYIGAVGEAHAGSPGLHFGVKLRGQYVDPAQYLGPVGTSGAIHLAPLVEELAGEVPHELSLAFEGASTAARKCIDPIAIEAHPPPPTQHVAVAVAGFDSSTRPGGRAEIYTEGAGPSALGYADEDIYEFSYAGVSGRDLHEEYGTSATHGDLKVAASKLMELLRAVHKRHPDRPVDIFAHSQGGVVARLALERMAGSFDPSLPEVANLITYATPHEGSSLAGAVGRLRTGTISGAWLLDRASDLARDGWPIPDPNGPAVGQLSPGSSLIEGLVREDVTFGTRVLALAMPHDVIVPADKALYDGKDSRILAPEGLNGHKALVHSPAAKAHVYAFLRQAPRACISDWQEGGQLIAKGLGLAAALPAEVLANAESSFTRGAVVAVRGLRSLAKWTGGRAGDAAELIASSWSNLWD